MFFGVDCDTKPAENNNDSRNKIFHWIQLEI